MGITYSVDIKINAKHDPKNMLRVMEEGRKLGFLYYQNILLESLVKDLEKSIDIFLATDPDSGDRFINIVFEDTNFFISFFKSDSGLLIISLVAFGSPWRSDYRDGIRMINLARYIRLLLRLCKDFIVLELKTSGI